MAVLLAVVLAAFHPEHDYFVALYQWIYHLSNYFRTLYVRCSYCYGAVIVYEKHLVKLNSVSGFSIIDVINEQFLSLFYLKLLTVILYIVKRFLRQASDLVSALI